MSWKGFEAARIHQEGGGSNQVNTFTRTSIGRSEEKTKSEGVEDQFFEFVRTVEDLETNSFFVPFFGLDLLHDTIDSLPLSFTHRKPLFVDLGETESLFNRRLFVGFF